MAKPENPIQLGSTWIDASGNLWKVVDKMPGGKVTLFDEKRVMFRDTYQSQIRYSIESGKLSLKVEA